MFSLQEASLMVSENLNNPNKSRAKGPSGRKLPTRKRPEECEEAAAEKPTLSPFDANFKKKLAKCLIQQKKVPEPEPDLEVDINLIGKINQAEFNKVWFFRVPSISSLVNVGTTPAQGSALEVVNDDTKNNNVSESSEKKRLSEKIVNNSSSPNSESDTNDEAEGPIKPKKTKIWKQCQIL